MEKTYNIKDVVENLNTYFNRFEDGVRSYQFKNIEPKIFGNENVFKVTYDINDLSLVVIVSMHNGVIEFYYPAPLTTQSIELNEALVNAFRFVNQKFGTKWRFEPIVFN
jgi:hypothetical protein